MIKQVLFDCGGVLVELKFREFIKELSGSDEVADYFKSNLWSDRSPWLRYDKGELNSQEVVAEMKKFIPAEYHGYLEAFLERWTDALPPMPGMEEIVDQLQAKGYRCYLLSNFAERFEEMPAKIPVLRKLDGMVISYRAHLLKPDAEAFRYTAERLGFSLEETLFVDDSDYNIEACEKLGMTGHLFTTPAAFKADLVARGIL